MALLRRRKRGDERVGGWRYPEPNGEEVEEGMGETIRLIGQNKEICNRTDKDEIFGHGR